MRRDGLGDKQRFSAADLEQVYRRRVEFKVKGCVLNQLLDVKTYEDDTLYLVSASGIDKVEES